MKGRYYILLEKKKRRRRETIVLHQRRGACMRITRERRKKKKKNMIISFPQFFFSKGGTGARRRPIEGREKKGKPFPLSKRKGYSAGSLNISICFFDGEGWSKRIHWRKKGEKEKAFRLPPGEKRRGREGLFVPERGAYKEKKKSDQSLPRRGKKEEPSRRSPLS